MYNHTQVTAASSHAIRFIGGILPQIDNDEFENW